MKQREAKDNHKREPLGAADLKFSRALNERAPRSTLLARAVLSHVNNTFVEHCASSADDLTWLSLDRHQLTHCGCLSTHTGSMAGPVVTGADDRRRDGAHAACTC